MGQMSALIQSHTQDFTPWVQDTGKHAVVGGRARIRLDIHMIGAEQLFRSLASQLLHLVRDVRTGLESLPWIPLQSLVGEHTSCQFHHSQRSRALRCDHLDIVLLAF